MAWRNQNRQTQQLSSQVAKILLTSLPGMGGMRPQWQTRNGGSWNQRGTGSGVSPVGSRNRCTCCGASNHVRRECRHAHKDSSTCGKVGHLAAVCRERERATDTAKSAPGQKTATKAAGPEKTYSAALFTGAPTWYCQECGDAVRPQLTKCPKKGCTGKKAPQQTKEPELLLLSKTMRNNVQQIDDPPADEDEEEGENEEEEEHPELQKLVNVRCSYTDNGMSPPQELMDQIEHCRKRFATPPPPTQEEKVSLMEAKRDIGSERIR